MKSKFFLIGMALIALLSFGCKKNRTSGPLTHIPVKESAKDAWGFVTLSGEVVVLDEFDGDVSCGYNGITRVTKDEVVTYYKITGKPTQIGEEYVDGTLFCDDRALVVKEDGYITLINTEGKIIKELKELDGKKVTYASQFVEAYAKFMNSDGKWGFIDKDGNVKIKAAFATATDFINGSSRVTDDKGNCYFIDKNGKTVFTPGKKVRKISPFLGFGYVFSDSDEKEFGIMDNKEEIKLKPSDKFNDIEFYKGSDYGTYRNGDKWGCIDKNGQIVEGLRAKYDGVFCYNDLVLFRDDDKWGISDLKGEKLLKADYDDILPFFSDVALVKDGDSWVFIDKKGEELKGGKSYDKVGSTGMFNFMMGISERTVRSHYFNMEEVVNALTNGISTDGTLGISFNDKITEVQSAIAALNSLSVKNLSSPGISSFEYFQLIEKNTPEGGKSEKTDQLQQTLDEAKQKAIADSIDYVNRMQQQGIATPEPVQDPFPGIGSYQSELSSDLIYMDNGISYRIEVTFDKTLKKAITAPYNNGYYTYDRIISYQLDNEARISNICVIFNIDSDKSEKLLGKLAEKFKSAGFSKQDDKFFVKSTTGIELSQNRYCLSKGGALLSD